MAAKTSPGRGGGPLLATKSSLGGGGGGGGHFWQPKVVRGTTFDPDHFWRDRTSNLLDIRGVTLWGEGFQLNITMTLFWKK